MNKDGAFGLRFVTLLQVVLTCLLIQGASAQEVEPWGSRDFSSKRVKPGKPGKFPSLVQIDPDEEPYQLTPARNRDGSLLDPSSSEQDASIDPPASDWFWSGISPALADSSPNRLTRALGQLTASDQDLGPTWAQMSALVSDFGPIVSTQAIGSQVSPAFALAVMSVESAGRVDVTSSAGAQGLMQLIPATAERFGVNDPFEPDQNISGGVKYLNLLLRMFGDDPILALAAYNAGEGAVIKHEGVPPYSETRAYIPKVLAAWGIARMFCEIPPDRVTDPCAFTTLESAG